MLAFNLFYSALRLIPRSFAPLINAIRLSKAVSAECDGMPEYQLAEFISQELASDMRNSIERIYIPDTLHNFLASDPYEGHKLNVSLKVSTAIT